MFPAVSEHGLASRRRGRGEGSIYKDEAKSRWYAAVSVGYGPDGKAWRRRKVSGRTRAEVAAKLKELHAEQDSGAEPVARYTIRRAIEDWLADGLDGRSASTVQLNRDVLKPTVSMIGRVELRKLSARDVRWALTALGEEHSSRTVVITHNALTRAIRHAEAPGPAQRGRAGGHAEGAPGPAEQGADRGAGGIAAGCGGGGAARGVGRPVPADGDPDGGGPGTALGSRGSRCGDDGGLAVGSPWRGYQDAEVAPNARVASCGGRGAAGASSAAGGRASGRRRGVAGSGAGVHDVGRLGAGCCQREEAVQGHLQGRGDRGRLGAAGTEDELCEPAVMVGYAGRGDRAARRPFQHEDNRGHLPQGTSGRS